MIASCPQPLAAPRLLRIALWMSHLCKVAGGHLKKRAGGNLANGCPPDCTTCTLTATPISWTLVASGISLCGVWTGNPNGTFTLTPDIACAFVGSPGNCGGGPMEWRISLPTTGTLRVICQGAGGGSACFPAFDSLTISRTTTGRCDESYTIANTITSCFVSGGFLGSVTITPNF